MRNTTIIRDPFREFDTLVRGAFAPRDLAEQQGWFTPAVDSFRDGNDAVLRLDLPGVDVANDVGVELRDQQLIISGTRQNEREDDSDGRHFREVRRGAFQRTFRVGPQVTADSISASYDAGVLTIRVAGAYAEPGGQRISISTDTVSGDPARIVSGSDGAAEDGQQS